jgi:glycosyltransferase involved in cell wall biosynthesis
MLNVCFLVDAPFLGGAERYIALIATHLDRTRFRPSVVMRRPDDPRSRLNQWREELEDENIPVHSIPMNLPFSPLHAIGIFRSIYGCRPHVVHVNMPGPHDAQMGLLVPLARMCGALGVVVTEHLPMVDTLWKRFLLKRISYRYVDTVLTVCHANVLLLTGNQGVRPEKTAVIHNALRYDYGIGSDYDRAAVRLEYGFPADAPVVLFVGNLLIHKGLARAARVLAEVPDAPWHLAVIGEGPDGEAAQKILSENNLGHRGSFLGSQRGAIVEKVLRAADVLTLPSDYEGMPYVILEAMAAGLAVVATTVHGIPEMVEDGRTGLLVQPGDEAALKVALFDVLGDETKRIKMGSRARERFERYFTMDKHIDQIQALYYKLARTDTGPRGEQH